MVPDCPQCTKEMMVAEFGRGCFVCERCCEFLLLLDEQSQSRNTQHQIVTEQACKKATWIIGHAF